MRSDFTNGSPYEGFGGEGKILEGENLEVDPPRKLVQSFRALWGEDVKADGTSRVTWEIQQIADSCLLKVTHDQLREGANNQLYGGWPMVLSENAAGNRRASHDSRIAAVRASPGSSLAGARARREHRVRF